MAEEVQGQAAEENESSESSEATIAVHWREEGYYPPPPKFIGQANASDPAVAHGTPSAFSVSTFPLTHLWFLYICLLYTSPSPRD